MSTRFWAAMALILTMVLPSVLLARGPVVAQAVTTGAGPTPVNPKRAEATALYNEGKGFFLNGNFETSLARFQAAMALDPTATMQFNICRALEQMRHRQQETLQCFKKYVQDYPEDEGIGYAKAAIAASEPAPAPPPSTPPPASAPASAPTSIAHPASIPTSGTLVIQGVSNELTARVDNVEVAPSDLRGNKPILLGVGSHAITVLDTKSNVVGKGQVRIQGGKSTTWTYFPPEEPPLLTRKQWGWVAVGTSAAALIGGSALGMLAKSEGPEAHTASAQDSVRGKMLGANIAFGTALVAGGVGAYLLLWGDDDTPHAELAPSPTGAVLTGTF